MLAVVVATGGGGGGGCGHGDSGGAGELDGHEHEYRKVTWPHRSLRELAGELPGEEGAGCRVQGGVK